MKTLIVVPAYNEAGSIAATLRDLRSHGYKNVVVIDDGSLDHTRRLARKEKVPVVSHVVNRGLGAALGTGFAYAVQNGFETVVTFDADGQHKARDISKLLPHIRSRRADVVIGSRFLRKNKQMPIDRKTMNYLSNILTFLLYGVWTTDSQSGLRVFNKKALFCIKIKTQRMEVSSEFFKEIKRSQLKFVEVPMTTIYTKSSQLGSHQEKWASIKMPIKLFLRLFR